MRKITKPLTRLTASAQRLASGDILVTADNPELPVWFPQAVGNGEVSRLTRAFRSMAFAVSAREISLKEQFKLLLDSTAEAIYGVDLNGKCVFSNPACPLAWIRQQRRPAWPEDELPDPPQPPRR